MYYIMYMIVENGSMDQAAGFSVAHTWIRGGK